MRMVKSIEPATGEVVTIQRGMESEVEGDFCYTDDI